MQVDFYGQNDLSLYQKIHAACLDIDVSILVNNVGIMPYGYYHKNKAEVESGVLDVNAMPFAILSKLFLDSFLLRHTRSGKRSAIINVSSSLEKFYLSVCPTYCASKAFMGYLSGGIHIENREIVDVLDHAPSMTESNLVPEIKRFNFFMTSA